MPLFLFFSSFAAPWPQWRRGFATRGAAALLALAADGVALPAYALNATEQAASYAAQSGQTPQPARGQEFFKAKHEHEWSCASCHTAQPTAEGKHASTGKPIRPMAPAANPERFTDAAKTEKWFRRNCNDVLGRECSASEKADVIAWLLTLKL